MKHTFEKSLVYTRDLEPGHVLHYSDFCGKKPGSGLATKNYVDLRGKHLIRKVSKNDLVQLDDV